MPNKLAKCTHCGEEKKKEDFGHSIYYAKVCLDCQSKYNLCADCGNRVDDKRVICCTGYHGDVFPLVIKGDATVELIEDKLDKLLKTQKQFQLDNQLDPPICDLASAIMAEGGELWSVSGGKWWKRYIRDLTVRGRITYPETVKEYIELVERKNADKIFEESIDILHFLLATWLRLGATAKVVFDAYMKKMDVNIKRQEDGY